MNKLILCEGATDAILLSVILKKQQDGNSAESRRRTWRLRKMELKKASTGMKKVMTDF